MMTIGQLSRGPIPNGQQMVGEDCDMPRAEQRGSPRSVGHSEVQGKSPGDARLSAYRCTRTAFTVKFCKALDRDGSSGFVGGHANLLPSRHSNTSSNCARNRLARQPHSTGRTTARADPRGRGA